MKKILSVILSLTMVLSAVRVVSADEAGNIIKVAVNAEFPPFEYYENDELTGFDIDLMNSIGEKIGYEIEYVNLEFDRLIPAVTSGEVNCAISAITQTDERREIVDFSRPYLRALITHNDGENITKRGEVYSIVFNEGMQKAKYKSSYPTNEEMIYILITDALDDLINDNSVDKLIDKYNLNKPFDEEAEYNYEYETVKGSQTPAAKEDEKQHISATTAPYSNWAKEFIEKAKDMGIIDRAKVYRYEKAITREEFCEIIYNYVSILGIPVPDEYIAESFIDTDNKKIATLYSMGIINGKSEQEFAPNDNLTREEAAVILTRMVNKTIDVPVTELYYEFEDGNEISDWADNSVQVMCNMGVMNGVGNNNFAPKESYTTEQAITTVMRVYDAQVNNLNEQNTDYGIIGGADGPTSIIVGSAPVENITEIIIDEAVEVDDFYIDEAVKLAEESGEMAGDELYISMYNVNEEAVKLSEVDYSKPKEIYYVSFNYDKVLEFCKATAENEDIIADIDVEKVLEYRKFNLSVFANLLNGRYGTEAIVMSSILANRKGYIMPENFENDFGLYMVYDGGYSVLVTYDEIGEGVIEGRMQYIKNGEKADTLSFMSELYSSLGKDCVTIGKVK